MPNCKSIIKVQRTCWDTNLGAIKKAYIADWHPDILKNLTEVNGEVTAIVMPGSPASLFYEFEFKKNAAFYTENAVQEPETDNTIYDQAITIKLQRIEIAKRNALSILCEGNRDLVVITESNNGDFRIFGLDAGLNASFESTSGETRNSGSMYTITISNSNNLGEGFSAYDVDGDIVPALLA